MKKIVALVLAMVMVMGLATTAFAAKMGTGFAAAQGDAGWDYVVTQDDAEDAKDETFATWEIEAVAKKDGVEAFWASLTDVEKGDKEDVEYAGFDTFVKVMDENFADVVVLVDGKTVTYFAPADEMTWDGKATKVTLPVMPMDAGDVKCNTLYADSAATATYYYYDYELYASDANGDTILNVGGVAVNASVATTGYTYVDHDYVVDYKSHTDNTDYTVEKVYCQFCKTSFKFVEGPAEVANAVFGDDNYQMVNNNAFLYIELVTPAIPGVTGASAGAAADGETVESAKTFDAGIAMYVGMSVMAAAGSAVVLKKKD